MYRLQLSGWAPISGVSSFWEHEEWRKHRIEDFASH
jgi:hypothetical protein